MSSLAHLAPGYCGYVGMDPYMHGVLYFNGIRTHTRRRACVSLLRITPKPEAAATRHVTRIRLTNRAHAVWERARRERK